MCPCPWAIRWCKNIAEKFKSVSRVQQVTTSQTTDRQADGSCHKANVLHRLNAEFGLSSTALDWVCSYLSDRRHYMKIGQHSSGLFDCSSGVPQCSVLGPLLFAVYVSPVGNVIESFGVRHQQYADDTQLYLSM